MINKCSFHIYDDTSIFINFVCEKISDQIIENKQLLFVSQNLTLDVVIKHYYQKYYLEKEKYPKMVYSHHLFYKTINQFFNKQNFKNQLQTQFKDKQNQLIIIIDFGSFCGSKYTVQEIIAMYNQLNNDIIQVDFCFDCRLLSPNELSYLVALIPHIIINGITINKQQSEMIKIPQNMDVKNVNSIVNSQMLDLIVKLARSDQQPTSIIEQLTMKRIQSQKNIQNTTPQHKRANVDKELGENSFLVSDQMASNLSNLNEVSIKVDSPGETGKMRRVNSKVSRGSKINLQFLEGANPNQNQEQMKQEDKEDKVIEFKFQTKPYQYMQ